MSRIEIMTELYVLLCSIVLLRTISGNNPELEFTVECGFMLDRYGQVLYNSLKQARLENLLGPELIKKCLPVYGT